MKLLSAVCIEYYGCNLLMCDLPDDGTTRALTSLFKWVLIKIQRIYNFKFNLQICVLDSLTPHLLYSPLFVYLFAEFTFSLFGISVLNSYKLPFYKNCPLQHTIWYVISITLVHITMQTINVNHPDMLPTL